MATHLYLVSLFRLLFLPRRLHNILLTRGRASAASIPSIHLHEEVGRIMQDGGSALDDGYLKRVFNALNNHYATRTATMRITLMTKKLTI